MLNDLSAPPNNIALGLEYASARVSDTLIILASNKVVTHRFDVQKLNLSAFSIRR